MAPDEVISNDDHQVTDGGRRVRTRESEDDNFTNLHGESWAQNKTVIYS